MDPEQYVGRILDNEGLAGDLDDPERTVLVEGLVARVADAVGAAESETAADAAVSKLAAFGRAAAKVVAAWRGDGPEAAAAVAKANKLPAPPAELGSPAAALAWLLDRA
jgi:hypothetical protein